MDSTKSTRPKNRGKSCLFQCFKPDNIIEDNSFEATSSPRAKTGDPLLTYIAVAEKEGIVLPTILSTALTAAKRGGDQGSGCHPRKKGSDNSLRLALMAALNETSLGKKIIKRRRKKKDSLFRSTSLSNIERSGDKISNQERRITVQTHSCTSTSSHCSPAFTPSSLSSTTSSNSSWGTQASSSSSEQYCTLRSLPLNGIEVTKQKQEEVGGSRKGCCGSNNMTLCLLLTSLLVLILYGKFCAIICTSIGFFVVSPRRRRPCKQGCPCEETDLDSVQYKKKIIMEGMLDRRSRNYSRS